MKVKIPFVITEDIRSITRFLPYTVSEKMAHYVSVQVLEICQKLITPEVLLLGEYTMTDWIAKVTPPNAILQTLAYTDLLETEYPMLQLTRAILWQEANPVQVSRSGYDGLESQLLLLPKGDYVLVDDVIFSGQSCREVILVGRELYRNITKIIACVSIGTGKKQLNDLGVEIESLYHFEDVVDEVCLRDFIPGLPFSGRPFIQNSSRFPFANGVSAPTTGVHKFVPYLLPWGDPCLRISVPIGNEVDFSLVCLELAIEFWSEVAPEIKLGEIPAPIYDLQADDKLYFVQYLHQCKKFLE